MYDHLWYTLDFRKVVATATVKAWIKPWLRKERLENLDILFLIDDDGARSYDTEYMWMYRHVSNNEQIQEDLRKWVELGELPAWANKLVN
jgi:hypothetical protein